MISLVITSPKTVPYRKTKFEVKEDTQLPLPEVRILGITEISVYNACRAV